MTFDVMANRWLELRKNKTRQGKTGSARRAEMPPVFALGAARPLGEIQVRLKVVKTTIPGEDPLRVSKLGKEHPELGLAG